MESSSVERLRDAIGYMAANLQTVSDRLALRVCRYLEVIVTLPVCNRRGDAPDHYGAIAYRFVLSVSQRDCDRAFSDRGIIIYPVFRNMARRQATVSRRRGRIGRGRVADRPTEHDVGDSRKDDERDATNHN
jgi:hypothetical protein